MTSLIGQTIGQYRIIEQIGRGGMATVYKAFQPSMERYVAIKVLPQQLAEDPTFTERFRQEAKAIAQLEHLHILPVYDYGEDHGLTYMIMRYMDSGTLTARLRKSIDVTEIVRLIGQVAEALDYTHSQGIVHRDIKPGNVLIDARGEALLTDFGIAKIIEGTTGLTGRDIIGTPKYMSPEQAQGHPVDGRSDIYSLGIILYEALVGRPPFEAETPLAVLLKHVNDPLPLPRAIKPEISPTLEQVILKSLAKDPADRYQTAGEMKQALERALTSAGQGLTQFSVTPVPSPTHLPEPATTPSPAGQGESGQGIQRPVVIGVILLLLILGIGGAAFLAFQGDGGEIPTQTPETAVAGADNSTSVASTETPTMMAGESAATDQATAAGQAVTEAGQPTEPPLTHTATPTPPPTPVEPTATPVAVATVAPALPPTPPPVETLAAVNVTGNPGKSDNPRLLFDGENILHLVWYDDSRQGENLGDFLHRQRTPDGEWSAAEYLTDDLDSAVGWASESLKLSLNPAGQVCVFWRGARGNGGSGTIGIFTRCLLGETWSAVEQVKNVVSLQDFSLDYAPDGTLQLLYIPGGGSKLLFNEVNLSDGFKRASTCALVIDPAGGYHAVWLRQGDPFSLEYRFSDDSGQSWSEPERLTDEETKPGNVLRLAVDDSGHVHLVWVGPGTIFYRRWTPEGGWGSTVELTQGVRSSGSTSIGLAVDAGGLAHVVWAGFGVYYAQQLEDGTWTQPRLIAEGNNSGPGPDIAIDSQGGRHFVWQVEDDALDLYYATLP